MMLRNVFQKTLRDQRRSLTWWGLGVALLTGAIIAIYPSIQGIEDLQSVMEAYPEELMALIGADSLTNITSPSGYLNAELFGFMVPAIFIIFGVSQGSSAIAGEERAGTLEILLSEPVTRGRLIVEKFCSMVASLVVLATVLWIALTVGSVVVNMQISFLRLIEITISVALLGLTFGAVAFAVGGITGRRGLSIGVASAAAVASYVLNVSGAIVDFMEPTRWISPFYYYNGSTPLIHGLNLAHAGALIAIVTALAVASYFAFQRRDLHL